MKLKSFNIRDFSHFESLEDFDLDVEKWLAIHKHDFTKAQLVGFKWLKYFASQIPGVCNPSIATILKAIEEDPLEHGISRTTFNRMIKNAQQLGIITVYQTEEENGAQSNNLYVFNRFPSSKKK